MVQQYGPTCVSLLSAPLGVAVPSKLPVFLLKYLERAVQSLSLENIRPVYHVLSGVGSSYLEILPFEVLAQVQGAYFSESFSQM